MPVDFDNNLAAVGKLLSFGRELQQLYMGLAEESPNRELQVLLQDTYSLLAYPNPRNSPVGYLLDPAQREPVCAALNSAILSECSVFVCFSSFVFACGSANCEEECEIFVKEV